MCVNLSWIEQWTSRIACLLVARRVGIQMPFGWIFMNIFGCDMCELCWVFTLNWELTLPNASHVQHAFTVLALFTVNTAILDRASPWNTLCCTLWCCVACVCIVFLSCWCTYTAHEYVHEMWNGMWISPHHTTQCEYWVLTNSVSLNHSCLKIQIDLC